MANFVDQKLVKDDIEYDALSLWAEYGVHFLKLTPVILGRQKLETKRYILYEESIITNSQ